ncbi:MAG: hypothetical protein HDR24_05415 [Lachnospiraceae bacterium]|nr:hypothetical protein [Lachnospiraceae bacterium]
MDAVYQAVKNFLKSFVNLFVAIIELFTTLINGVAFVIGKLRPHISEKYAELKNNGSKLSDTARWGTKGKRGNVLEWKDGEEELAEKIRVQLNEKITGRNQYLFLYAKVSETNFSFYAIILSVLALVLAGGITLGSGYGSDDIFLFALIVMTLACAAACIMIIHNQKKEMYNRIIRQILEEEFRDRDWEKNSETAAANQENEKSCETVTKQNEEDAPDAGMLKETSAEASALE